LYDIPELAISVFEKIHGLNVTVHDLRGSLWAFLAPNRFRHVSPLCEAAKARLGEALCVDFEVRQLRSGLHQAPDGLVHVCHAGLVEWVVPVYSGVDLEWVLFAGPRMPCSALTHAIIRRSSGHDLTHDEPAKPVGDDESDLIMEHLRQLASRLTAWRDSVEELHSRGASVMPLATVADRQSVVRRFIATRHTEPVTLQDLADALCLSESRASHVVRESCGATFQELLREARIRTAMGLLRHTSLSVVEIALRCGFADPGTFHRTFRLTSGSSPGRFRRLAGV